ncbi:hypothetical protein JCGZ_14412 [Jatropha curcas]|uniref:Uncharacterized protein n=2 Tax=Jatropha curcas TaxID=180498 RepID=A0A067JXE9_JATCU|nr:hypothetical protein JCGZ_14412 [Jatropha curcas]
MIGTVVASYFLLTADYGPEPNVFDPIKKALLSAESSVKEYIFGSKKEPEGGQMEKLSSNSAKEH